MVGRTAVGRGQLGVRLFTNVGGDGQVACMPAGTVGKVANLGLDLVAFHLALFGIDPLVHFHRGVGIHEKRKQFAGMIWVNTK